jgi:adenosylhomocysteine nucleosidase
MHEELRALVPGLRDARCVRLAGRDFHVGVLAGRPVVLVLSGIGKVAAATTATLGGEGVGRSPPSPTATLLIHEFAARALVFTGVAGGLGDDVRVGDVVLARELLQHDMDASPLFPRFEVPLTGRSHFASDPALSDGLKAAAQACLARIGHTTALPARLHEGLVVSGDRFVSSATEALALRVALPQALAVEMEGAALAQVCADFDRPFAVLRTISDRADDSAHVDFSRFVAEVASVYTRSIVEDWLAALP